MMRRRAFSFLLRFDQSIVRFDCSLTILESFSLIFGDKDAVTLLLGGIIHIYIKQFAYFWAGACG